MNGMMFESINLDPGHSVMIARLNIHRSHSVIPLRLARAIGEISANSQ